MSSQMLGYINIFDITRNLLTQIFHMEVKYFVSYHCQMHKLVLILPIFHTFLLNSQNNFISADFCMY